MRPTKQPCALQDCPQDCGPSDVVSCMFAIHYFFVSEAAVKQFLKNVSDNLKVGE